MPPRPFHQSPDRPRPAVRFRRRPAKPRPAPVVPEELTDSARGIRLQKAMAAAGVASRRDCEAMIVAGRVCVNGRPVTKLPAWVDPSNDRIEVDGTALRRQRADKPAGRLYVMLHKPKRVISTARDEAGRRCVTDLVQLQGADGLVRLFPVGRLDADSTGLMLLTNDGSLANQLTHPRYQVAKEYLVAVKGRLEEADLQRLRDGLYLAHPQRHGLPGRPRRRAADRPEAPTGGAAADTGPVEVLSYKQAEGGADKTILRITLREGQTREVRPLLAYLGFKVRKLMCTAIGPLRLKGLSAGHWRFLTPPELHALQRAAASP